MNNPNIFKQFWSWIQSAFHEEYELTVWYVYERTTGMDDVKVIKRKPRSYRVSRITKKSHTHIRAELVEGGDLEIRTVMPFDYEIRKI